MAALAAVDAGDLERLEGLIDEVRVYDRALTALIDQYQPGLDKHCFTWG